MLTSERWIDFDKMEDRVRLGLEQDVSSNKFSKDLAAATTRGMIRNAQAGGRLGGRVPIGYRWQYIDGPNGSRVPDRLIADPATAPLVRWIFATYAIGETSLRQIANDLNERREPTASARSGEGPVDGKWSMTAVRQLLKNERYIGHQVWNRVHCGRFLGIVSTQATPLPGGQGEKKSRNAPADFIRRENVHEAIIDLGTWNTVQRRLEEGRKRTTPIPYPRLGADGGRTSGSPYSLTGLLVCSHCKHRMAAGQYDHGKGAHLFYMCEAYARGGRAACNKNSFLEKPLLGAIVAKLGERFTPEILADCRRLIRESVMGDDQHKAVGELAARLETLDEQLAVAVRRALTERSDRLPTSTAPRR